MVFVFSFIAKQHIFILLLQRQEMTFLMRSHFEKYAFLHHILVVFLISLFYKNILYCCWFEFAETPKMIYYTCMTLSNDVIGIHDDITL